mmetsp:Transcript_41297/g.162808  ORF Transcript_41297/g.162808 Transcript_41297/m.162808 type:complete len:96 (-) Transcript_41297:1207-1494(-)
MGLALRFVDYAGSARRALFLQKTTSQLVYTILKTTAVILRGRGTGRFRAHLEKQSISGGVAVRHRRIIRAAQRLPISHMTTENVCFGSTTISLTH